MNKKFQLLTLFIIAALLSSTSFAKKRSMTCAEYYSGKSLERKASRFRSAINHAAKKHGVNRDFIKAVITIESCFRPNARGALGEKGLMQLMPATARSMGVKNGYNSWQNIDGGTRYLKYLLRRFNGNKSYAAAAYNGGPGAVSKTKGPRFPQVRRYSRHVMHAYRKMSGARDVVGKSTSSKSLSKKTLSTKRKKQRAKVKVAKGVTTKGKTVYRVKQGQTLFSIARVTGIDVERLKKINKLSSTEIKVGQVLRLKTKSGKVLKTKNKAVKRNVAKKKTAQTKTHHVSQSDTLYSISRKTGVSVKRLTTLNKLKSTEIKVGQDLRLQ